MAEWQKEAELRGATWEEAIRQAVGCRGAAASYSEMSSGKLIQCSTGSHKSAVESCPCHRTKL